MRTSVKKTARACIREYEQELAVQLELFGADEMDSDLLIEAYARLRNPYRARALEYILGRKDRIDLTVRTVSRVVGRILQGDRETDVRIQELARVIEGCNEKGLKTLWHFAMSSANRAKTNSRK